MNPKNFKDLFVWAWLEGITTLIELSKKTNSLIP